MNTTKQIEKLEHELKQLRERQRRRRVAAERDTQRSFRLRDELLRLRVVNLTGKPDAVKLRYRQPPGSKHHYLNSATGTVQTVRRTRALVRFSTTGEKTWDVPLSELIPADETQGMIF